MRESTEIFIPIPKTRNTKVKIEVGGDDLTGRIIESLFTKPLTKGIGTFKIVVSNAGGQYTGSYNSGDLVKLYADNTDASTLQFWGRIDNIKEVANKKGKFLEIEGRHRSYLLTESLVCHTTTNTAASQILKDIIDKLPSSYGFTYSNVSTTTDSMNVEWNYKPFCDCVIEICNFAGYDYYVDDDLDFHFFEENSIVNTTDAVVEGDNLIDSKGWGINNYYEKTRVIVMGQSEDGLPIIWTSISPNEGTEIREIFIKNTSVNTLIKAKNLADAQLFEYIKKIPNATTKSFGLETIKTGENIWVLIPRQEIYKQYKIIQILHSFGMKIGGWRTDLIFERGEGNISQVLSSLGQKTGRIEDAPNPYKFNYSWNFEFDVDSGTHSNTEVIDGVLKTDGSASGTWISESKIIDDDVSVCELRMVGESLPGTVLFISLDNGGIYIPITNKTKKVVSGNKIKIKVEINSADTQVYSLALLYS